MFLRVLRVFEGSIIVNCALQMHLHEFYLSYHMQFYKFLKTILHNRCSCMLLLIIIIYCAY